MPWAQVFILVITNLIGLLRRPKPPSAERSTLGDVTFANSIEGKSHRIAFGCPDQDQPSVVLKRNLNLVAVRKKGGKK